MQGLATCSPEPARGHHPSARTAATPRAGAGFTQEGAQWMATNLKPRKDGMLDW